MASKYVKDLRELGEQLKFDGYPISSATCVNAAIRMKMMEKHIVEVNEKLKEITGGK